MCNLLQNIRWIKYWLLALSQSDCRIFNQMCNHDNNDNCYLICPKRYPTSFQTLITTYLQLGCWSIHCIWYSQFSNRVRNHGYTVSVLYQLSQARFHNVTLRYQRQTTNILTANEWPIVGKIYTGCVTVCKKNDCTSHSFLSCRYCVANNFVNTPSECCDWPRYIGVSIGVNQFTQVILLMINPS